MPRGDGTGPLGLGPMTGRAAGFCAGYPVPGFMNPIPGRWAAPVPYAAPAYGYGGAPGYGYWPGPVWGRGFGRGLGWGRGRGRGFGRGLGRGRGWRAGWAPYGYGWW